MKATDSGTNPKPRVPWLGPHTGAPLVMLVLATWLVLTAAIRFNTADPASCPNGFSADTWLTGGFVAVVGAFFLGGLLGNLPHHRPAKETAGLITQLGITLLVAMIAGALWYETRAVAGGSNGLLPITHYVMCLKFDENDWTLFVFLLAALLAGRWLWHRPGTYLQ